MKSNREGGYVITTRKTGYFMLSAIVAVAAASLAGDPAWGQTPPDAGRLLEETQKSVPPRQVKPKLELAVPQQPAAPAVEAAKVMVQRFSFTMDVPVVSEAELVSLLRDYTGRQVSFTELEQAADKVTRYLKGKGFLLAKAYLPQQDVVNGVVAMTILVGRSEGGSRVEASGRLKPSVVEKIMNRAVREGEPLRLGDLERGILLVNDLPGVSAASSLSAGSAPGTTRITVKANQGPWASGSVNLDNFGNRFTGSERFIGAVSINNPSGYGDQVTLNGVQAGDPVFDTNGGKMYLWKAGWQVPVGYSGLKLGAAYTQLYYRIGEELASTDSSGTAKSWTVNASYPLARSRDCNLYGNLSYENRNLKNLLGGETSSDKRVKVGTAGIQGDATDGLGLGGSSWYGLAISGGDLDLSRVAVDLDIDQQTRKSNGTYWKLSYNGARQQNLGEDFSLFGTVSGQFAGQGLDSSEQLTLGGPTGVRAYPPGEGTGDQGALVNLELRKDFSGSSSLGHLQAVAFYDYGWVEQHQSTWPGWNGGNPGLRNSYSLNGAGAGLNLSRSTRSLQFLLKTFWATTIGTNPGKSASGHDSDGKNLDNRFWVQGVMYF